MNNKDKEMGQAAIRNYESSILGLQEMVNSYQKQMPKKLPSLTFKDVVNTGISGKYFDDPSVYTIIACSEGATVYFTVKPDTLELLYHEIL